MDVCGITHAHILVKIICDKKEQEKPLNILKGIS